MSIRLTDDLGQNLYDDRIGNTNGRSFCLGRYLVSLFDLLSAPCLISAQIQILAAKLHPINFMGPHQIQQNVMNTDSQLPLKIRMKPAHTAFVDQKGDSPFQIAKRYNMDLGRFLSLNRLWPNDRIYPGQTVYVE